MTCRLTQHARPPPAAPSAAATRGLRTSASGWAWCSCSPRRPTSSARWPRCGPRWRRCWRSSKATLSPTPPTPTTPTPTCPDPATSTTPPRPAASRTRTSRRPPTIAPMKIVVVIVRSRRAPARGWRWRCRAGGGRRRTCWRRSSTPSWSACTPSTARTRRLFRRVRSATTRRSHRTTTTLLLTAGNGKASRKKTRMTTTTATMMTRMTMLLDTAGFRRSSWRGGCTSCSTKGTRSGSMSWRPRCGAPRGGSSTRRWRRRCGRTRRRWRCGKTTTTSCNEGIEEEIPYSVYMITDEVVKANFGT